MFGFALFFPMSDSLHIIAPVVNQGIEPSLIEAGRCTQVFCLVNSRLCLNIESEAPNAENRFEH